MSDHEWAARVERYALARRRAAQRWARLAAAHPFSSGYAAAAATARETADRWMVRALEARGH